MLHSIFLGRSAVVKHHWNEQERAVVVKGMHTRKKKFCCFFHILQGIWDSMGCPIYIKIRSVIL